jgi:hypothetical protein
LVGLVGLSVWLIACGGGERIISPAAAVRGSGSTGVGIPITVRQGTQVSRIDANTFNISGVGRVRSPVDLDTNGDGELDKDVLVITAGSSPLGFPGFRTSDNAVVVVRIRGRQEQLPSVTVPIDVSGALLENVALPPGDYAVTVENVTLSSDGNRLRIGEMTYAFSVFVSGGALRHTLPTAVSYRLPVVGQPVENVFLELTVDTAASTAGARGVLFVDHANGEINLKTSVGTDGKVTFQSQPGGPTLGTVSTVTVSVLLPPPSPSP